MAVCDVILLGQPVSGTYYDLSSFGAVQEQPEWRAMAGAMGGLVSAFFIPFGFWYIKNLLAGPAPKSAMAMFVAFCSTIFFAGAFHAGYYFLHPAVAANAGGLQKSLHYLELLSYLAGPGFGVGTIIYIVLVSRAGLPGWVKWANPLITCGIFLALFSLLPAPAGGYLKPSFVNLGWAIWFAAIGFAPMGKK